VDNYWLQRLTNYGAFAEPVFAKADVTSPQHPDHAELLTLLRQPFMKDSRVDMQMLMPIIPEIVQSEVANPWLLVSPRPEIIGLEPRKIVNA
jgi:hypothetical protein